MLHAFRASSIADVPDETPAQYLIFKKKEKFFSNFSTSEPKIKLVLSITF